MILLGLQGNGVRVESVGIDCGQIPGEKLVLISALEAKRIEHGILQRLDIAVLAEDHGDDQPMVRRAHGTVLSVEALKGVALPLDDGGWSPGPFGSGLPVVG